MIKDDFNFALSNLNYSVILSKIKIEKVYSLDELFDIINVLQDQYDKAIIQFFKDDFILNREHIFYAVYFSQKAFKQKINISNKKSIEFLLYLAANRQIRIAIDSFGINPQTMKNKIFNICLVSDEKDIADIYQEVINRFSAEELEPTFDKISEDKIQKIKNFFEISEVQIFSVLSSIKSKSIQDFEKIERNNDTVKAILDLICEKMSLLSLEGV